jgi:hypothetical protein
MTNDPKYGHFLDEDGVVLQPNEFIIYTGWCRDSRDMIVIRKATYLDPFGEEWVVNPGDRINGLTVWRMFWRIIWPYAPRKREASAFHDVECESRSKPSWKVHRMFYNAMRANGVSKREADCWYFFVKHFGPKFEGDTDEDDCDHSDRDS